MSFGSDRIGLIQRGCNHRFQRQHGSIVGHRDITMHRHTHTGCRMHQASSHVEDVVRTMRCTKKVVDWFPRDSIVLAPSFVSVC